MSFHSSGRSTPPLNNSSLPFPSSIIFQQPTDDEQAQSLQPHDGESGSEDDLSALAPRSRIGSFSRFEIPAGTPLWGTLSPSPVSRSPMLLECCCGRENCPNLTQFISNSRAMEEELRLAAEVGQALLQKHELYQKETQEFQSALEQQCSRAEKETQELQELVRELQQEQRSWNREREDAQREKGEILDLVRELQQTQRSLELERDDAQRQKNLVENKNESLAAALEASYVRARELTKELDNRENEIKRLMANNIKSEKSEEREEDLRRQMEDLKQELTVARKAESAAEARVRKLKTKYGEYQIVAI